MCPRCQQSVRCISVAWAPKKLYLCPTCQEVRHASELRVPAPAPPRAQT